MSTLVEGKEVKVGDVVGFKCDVEQCGVIVKIERNWAGKAQLTLAPCSESFHGEYISGSAHHSVLASDCWVD